MKFSFVSRDGTGLAFALRVKSEGHDVKYFIPMRTETAGVRNVGKGLIDRASSIEELMMWGRGGVFVFDMSHEGKWAEQLRMRGELVIGGGILCDRLELDREFGTTIVQNVGCLTPKTHTFPTISATLAFLKTNGDQDWYFKTDAYLGASVTSHGDGAKLSRRLEAYRRLYKDQIPNLLQETIEGIDISTAAWWNGRDWLYPFEGTVENKKLMDGDVGPATGCAMNIAWWYDEPLPKIALELRFTALAEIFRRLNAPPCIYDINALISKKDRLPYFLEWTPRFGYDSEPTAQRAITGDLGEFYYNLASGRAAEVPFDRTRAQMGVRVSVQPYPWENVDKLPYADRTKAAGASGTPIHGPDPRDLRQMCGADGHSFVAYGVGLSDAGTLEVADHGGLVGLVCADGIDAEAMNNEILDFIEDDLDIPDKQYRTDAGAKMDAHLEKIRASGYSTGVL